MQVFAEQVMLQFVGASARSDCGGPLPPFDKDRYNAQRLIECHGHQTPPPSESRSQPPSQPDYHQHGVQEIQSGSAVVAQPGLL